MAWKLEIIFALVEVRNKSETQIMISPRGANSKLGLQFLGRIKPTIANRCRAERANLYLLLLYTNDFLHLIVTLYIFFPYFFFRVFERWNCFFFFSTCLWLFSKSPRVDENVVIFCYKVYNKKKRSSNFADVINHRIIDNDKAAFQIDEIKAMTERARRCVNHNLCYYQTASRTRISCKLSRETTRNVKRVSVDACQLWIFNSRARINSELDDVSHETRLQFFYFVSSSLIFQTIER